MGNGLLSILGYTELAPRDIEEFVSFADDAHLSDDQSAILVLSFSGWLFGTLCAIRQLCQDGSVP